MHAFLWHKGLMTDLGTPVEEGDSYRAIAINDRGQVIITSDPGNRPFFWEKGVITDLGAQAPQGYKFEASNLAINSKGQVLVSSIDNDGAHGAFLWKKGVLTKLGTLGGRDLIAYAMNDRGQVIGQSDTAGYVTHHFLWTNGVTTDLTTQDGPQISPNKINNKSEIMGGLYTSDAPPLWYAAFWKKGVTINLGDFGATSAGFPCYETRRGSCSQATDINNKGQIIGFALNTTGETHAFLWHKKGGMTDLSKLGGSGLLSPSFADINDKGQVVGWALTPNKERHAILWDSKCVRVHNRDFEKDDSKKDRN